MKTAQQNLTATAQAMYARYATAKLEQAQIARMTCSDVKPLYAAQNTQWLARELTRINGLTVA